MRAEYADRGFVLQPGLLSIEETRVLNAEVDRILDQAFDEKRLILEKDGETVRTVLNPHLWNDVFAKLVRHPDLLSAVENLLGEQVYAWQMGVNCKAALNGDVWYWHQDYPGYLHDDHIPESRMVNVLIYLDDANELSGPLMLVPGSHKVTEAATDPSNEGTSYTFRYASRTLIESEVDRAGIIAPTGEAGSAILMDVNLLHGSTANLSPWPRRLITLTYNAISNKATRPSVRPAHIVPDDRETEALEPLSSDVLSPTRTYPISSNSDELSRPLWADVDLSALTHNIETLKVRAARPVKMIIPVKANAYGHGIVAVGRHLEQMGVDGLATANIDDAIQIRKAGIKLPVLMYGGQLPDGNATLLAHDLTPSVYSDEGLTALAALAERQDRKINVHVKVDAGLGRLGVRLDEAAALIRRLLSLPGLELEGLYTHIPFGDASGAAWSKRRLAAFVDLVTEVESEHNMSIPFAQGAASSVMSHDFPDKLNTISPGHLLFGLSPVEGLSAGSQNFRKAMTGLRTRLVHIGSRKQEDDLAGTNSDGLDADATTGVLLLGMDNGYMPAAAGQTAHVLCRGQRCPVLAVSCEYTVVDLSGVAGAALGDEVTIIGDDGDQSISVEDVASAQGAPSAAYWMVGLKNVPFRYRN
jgi:alanine racemase